jgi:hypothetical protein
MSWTPAPSIGPRAAHPSTMRILREHRESTDLFRSYLEGSDPVGKDSPRFAHLFSCHSTPFFSTFPHRLRAERGDARAHSRKRKWAHSAQFWCNLSPLDATLLDPLVCVADKGLARYLSPVDATLTKNRGVGVHPYFLALPPLRSSLVTHHPHSARRRPIGRKLNHAVS